MAKKLYEESNISAIAESIRAKTGTDTKYKTSEMPGGVSEVYESGRQDVISKSKYIPKTASGKGVFLTDVSEVAHKVKVYADADTEVKVCGKNFFNNDTSLIKSINYANSSGQQTKNGYELSLPKGTYTFTLHQLDTAGHYVYGVTNDKDGNFVTACNLLAGTTNYSPLTITLNEGDKVYIYDGVSVNLQGSRGMFDLMQIQLEAGYASTPYEPYQEPQTITATPDGTETPSMCPTMTFIADNDVTVDYYGSYGMAEKEMAMWNRITNYGTRKSYTSAFGYVDFGGCTIPQGLCKPNAVNNMFYSYVGQYLPDGVDCSEFNNSTSSYHPVYMFAYSRKLKRIYDMGIPAGVLYNSTFHTCDSLEEIEIIRCNETTTFTSNAFQSCSALEKVKFEGTIASDINLQWSKKLDMESLGSLFRCLKNYLADDPDNAHTKTVTLSAESWALLDTYVYENGWNDYVNAKDVVSTVLGWNYA